MYNRLDTIPACDGQTDGRKDGQTDIIRRHSPRYAYASRGKKNDIHIQLTLSLQFYLLCLLLNSCELRWK